MDVFGVPAGNRSLQASLYNTAVQTVLNNTNTPAIFNAHDYDEGGFHSDTVNNTKIIIPPGGSGIYLFTYYIIWQQFTGAIANALREAFLQKNGVNFGMLHATLIDTTGANFAFNIASLTAAAVEGDSFELIIFQSSGVSQDAGNATRAFANTFTLTRLR